MILGRLLAAALSLAACAQAAELRVMGFGGSSNWPLFVAAERGFLAREGLEARILAAHDSATQLADLVAGRIDVALTAMDNVVACDEGQGDGACAMPADLVAILGVNRGARFRLYASRSVHAIAELKGKSIGVDSTASGYAFIAREMLASGGLGRDDYDLARTGGSRERWHALREGRVAATLLNAPYDASAEAEGFTSVAGSEEVASRYQGSVAAVRREWARAHASEVRGFVRAWVAATEWLRDPANAAEARAILRRHVPRMSAEESARSYAELLDPAQGSLSPRGEIDLDGVRTVLRLRSRHAPGGRRLDDPARYCDATYYEQALAKPQ